MKVEGAVQRARAVREGSAPLGGGLGRADQTENAPIFPWQRNADCGCLVSLVMPPMGVYPVWEVEQPCDDHASAPHVAAAAEQAESASGENHPDAPDGGVTA